MMQKSAFAIAACLSVAVVVGCSGGGSTPSFNPRTPSPIILNNPPIISGDPGTSATINQSYAFTPDASDPNGDSLTFLISNAPPWATFDSDTGELSGTPAPGDAAVYADIQISVSDGRNSSALPAFSITVNQSALGTITLTWTAPTSNTDGTVLSDLTAYRLRYGTESGTYLERVEISTPGITTFVVENLAPNTYYFVLTSINSQNIESAFSNEASALIQ